MCTAKAKGCGEGSGLHVPSLSLGRQAYSKHRPEVIISFILPMNKRVICVIALTALQYCSSLVTLYCIELSRTGSYLPYNGYTNTIFFGAAPRSKHPCNSELGLTMTEILK
jgi:hypothetical protein